MKTLKRTLCLVLVAVMALSLFAVAASAKKLSDYTDASAVSAEYQVAVDTATQLGILEGMGADTYGAKGTLTRAQLATMLYRMVTGQKTADNYAGGSAFADVKADAWYAGYVNYCADKGLLAGVGANKYNPNSALTGYETLAAFLRALGYGKDGEFVGATWKAGVTKYADAIDGEIVADWSKPITREVAAQLIYNTLKANIKVYNAQYKNYVDTVWGGTTLAREVFKVNVAGIATNFVDNYGTLGEIWTAGSTQIVKAAYPVVKSYNVKTTGCTVLKDLGIPETDLTSAPTYTKWTYDGESGADTLTHKASDCAVTFGDQGVMTTIYKKATNNYVIAEVETYLAKISKNTAAAAHVEADVEAGIFTAGGVDTEDVLNGTAYAVNTFVLVIRGQNDTWTVIGAAPSKVATLDKYDTVAGALPTWTVGGTPYASAKNWIYNEDYKTTTPSATAYTWYFDQFGNIIGIDTYAAPKTYGVVDAIAWDDGAPLEAGKAVANVVYMDASKGNSLTFKKAGDNALKNDDNDEACTYDEATLNDTVEYNADYRTYLYEISDTTITKAGEALKGTKSFDWEWSWSRLQWVRVEKYDYATSIKNGFAAIGDYSGSESTVYLLRYKDATGAVVYKSFTGFKAMPSVENAYVEVIRGNDIYVEYAFVDATVEGACVTDTVATTITAFIATATAAKESVEYTATGNVTIYTYNVYVDGKLATIKTTKAIDGITGFVGEDKLYDFTADSTGYVVKAAEVTTAGKMLTEVTDVVDVADDKSSARVTIGGTTADYDVTATPVYVYDGTNMAVKTFADDVTFTGKTVYAVVSATGESLVAVYVW